METKIIYFEDFKKERKRKKLKKKMTKTIEWFIDNKEIVIPLCSALFESVTYGTKQIIKHRQNKKQNKKQKDFSERLSDILEEFKVLK